MTPSAPIPHAPRAPGPSRCSFLFRRTLLPRSTSLPPSRPIPRPPPTRGWRASRSWGRRSAGWRGTGSASSTTCRLGRRPGVEISVCTIVKLGNQWLRRKAALVTVAAERSLQPARAAHWPRGMHPCLPGILPYGHCGLSYMTQHDGILCHSFGSVGVGLSNSGAGDDPGRCNASASPPYGRMQPPPSEPPRYGPI
eukprot:767542-Hanusia_phi.AAC.2